MNFLGARIETGEGPWSLPAGWAWAKLEALLPLQYGKALEAPQRDQVVAFPFSAPAAKLAGTVPRSRLQMQSLLDARVRPVRFTSRRNLPGLSTQPISQLAPQHSISALLTGS